VREAALASGLDAKSFSEKLRERFGVLPKDYKRTEATDCRATAPTNSTTHS
jgi:AraC-like DNA-binding protein